MKTSFRSDGSSASRCSRWPWILTQAAVLSCGFIGNRGNLFADDRVVLRNRVEELIRGLDAATLAERTHAERNLIELGSDVLPLLPSPELIDNPSARDAVRRIRPVLERIAARESTAPALISVKGKVTVGELVEQIQRQSKNIVILSDGAQSAKDIELNVDWNNERFWVGVDDVCRQACLTWQFVKDRAAIQLVRAPSPIQNPLAIQCTGPFRIAINQVERRHVVGREDHQIVRISGVLAIEPRLRPLFLSVHATNLKATAGGDQPLEPWNPDAKYEFPFGESGREVGLRWDFRQPRSVTSTTLAIRGSLSCQIAAATERVVFDQTSLTRGTIRRRGGASVRIRRVQSEPLDAEHVNQEIGIVVSYDNGGPAFESHRSWIFHNAAYLESKAGQRTSYTDFEISQQTDSAIAVDYRWQNIPRSADGPLFVYEAPTLISNLPVDVDLKSIAMTEDSGANP